jgi:hypothetical protein
MIEEKERRRKENNVILELKNCKEILELNFAK